MCIDRQWYIGPLCIDLCGGHWRDLELGIRLNLQEPPLDKHLSIYLLCWCLSFSWDRDWRTREREDLADEDLADTSGSSSAGCDLGTAASTDGAETADQPCIKEYNGIVWFGPGGRC